MRLNRRGWTITAAAVGFLLVASVVLLANLQWLRGPVQSAITRATGREAHVGALRLSPWFPPGLVATDISLANAAASKDTQMLEARRIAVQPLYLRLLRGQLAFRAIEADGLHLLLETDERNVGNWQFERQGNRHENSEPGAVEIRRLALRDSTVRIHEQALHSDLTLAANSEPVPDKAGTRVNLSGKGRWRAAPVEIGGYFDLPVSLQARALRIPVSLDARAGATRLRASGTLPAAITTRGATLDVHLTGDSLGDLFALTGIALPETPPYDLAGKLGWKASRLTWKDFRGRIGDSQMQGEATLDWGGKRPRLVAKLQSPLLDFDDLGALLGIPPDTSEGETASPEQKQAKAGLVAQGKVLPRSEFNYAKLRAIDADVELEAARINAPKLPLQSLKAHVDLADGLLKVEPLDFRAAGGTLHTRIALDARRKPMSYDLNADIRQLKLAELVPQAESLRDAAGSLDGRLQMKGEGNSVAAIFASADGELQMIMGGGQVSNLLLEVAGLDVAESLKFLLGKDRNVPIRCAYADFKLEQGIATASALAVDTSDTALLGKGDINLRDERFDLVLLPKPKDTSPISLRSPLTVGGSFLDPSFGPEPGPLLLRGAAVAALAILAPPAALLGLLETGPGEDVACGPGQRADTPQKKPPARVPPGPRPANAQPS